MSKDAYYFPHDSNAIQDPKMMTLLFECGLVGIGAFWVIIEILHQQPSGTMRQEEVKRYLDFYGHQGAWSEDVLMKCEHVFYDTGLLVIKEGFVTSNRVRLNLKKRNQLIIKGKESALRRWVPNANPLGNPLATQCQPNAIKESKGKESNKDKDMSNPAKDAGIRPADISEEPNDESPTSEHLMNWWNETAPTGLPRVASLSPIRKAHATARLREHPELDYWKRIMDRIKNSKLLLGEVDNRNGHRPWRATFDWILNANNLAKVEDGNYDNRR